MSCWVRTFPPAFQASRSGVALHGRWVQCEWAAAGSTFGPLSGEGTCVARVARDAAGVQCAVSEGALLWLGQLVVASSPEYVLIERRPVERRCVSAG